MDLASLINSILLGVIEGVTEFLPISSTGHLIVATAALQFPPQSYRDTFEIFIQLGAILAVTVFFARDLLSQARALTNSDSARRFWVNILIAFLPAAVIGFLFRKQITLYLFKPVVVGVTLLLGGLVFLWVESRPRPEGKGKLDEITPRDALFIGIAQVVSLVPGVSRSAATILGGMFTGLNRSLATRFSFYLAIPTLGIATLYQLFSAVKDGEVHAAEIPVFAVGTVVAFIVALVVVAWFLRFVATHSFRAFGVYRVIAGVIILFLALATTALG